MIYNGDLQAEARRFLAALGNRAKLQGSSEFAVAELFDVADSLELRVPDLSSFIEALNDAGAVPSPVIPRRLGLGSHLWTEQSMRP